MFDNQQAQASPAGPAPMNHGSPHDAMQPAYEYTPVAGQPSSTSAAASSSDDDLLGLKRQALDNLTPLVDKLEQSPEEKFKTTMMLIQASDNAGLTNRDKAAGN
jgi:hypothetical protein